MLIYVSLSMQDIIMIKALYDEVSGVYSPFHQPARRGRGEGGANDKACSPVLALGSASG